MYALLLILLILAPSGVQKHQTKPDNKQAKASDVSSPFPTPTPCATKTCEICQPGSDKGTKQTDDQSESIWQKAFAPEYWSQWGLLLAAVIAAIIYWHTLRATESNARAIINAERPWVLVTETSQTSEHVKVAEGQYNDRGGVHFKIKNWGKTPALIHEVLGSITYVPSLKDDVILEHAKYLIPYSCPLDRVLAPGDESGPGIVMLLDSKFTHDDWVALSDKKTFLVMYGSISYSDVLEGKKHISKFCYEFSADNPPGFYFTCGPKSLNEYT